MAMNPKIFRAEDIRGIYGKDFDADVMRQLGMHVAAYLKSGTFVVGRTEHAAHDEQAYAVIDGAMHAGAQVIDVGMVSFPQLQWAIRSLGAVGGILISHAPESAFRVVAHRGGTLELVPGHMLRQIHDGHVAEPKVWGAVARHDIVDGYAATIAYAARWRGGIELRMSIDGPETVHRVLRRLGPIAPDDAFAARFDAHGEHVIFFERGREIPADVVFALLTRSFRRYEQGSIELPELTLLRVYGVVHEPIAP